MHAKIAQFSTIARRYAEALLAALTPGDAADVAKIGQHLNQPTQENARLRAYLESRDVADADKQKIILDMIGGAIPPEFNNFFKVLSVRNRMPYLLEILEVFNILHFINSGKTAVTITAAHALSNDDVEAITAAIAKRTNRQIVAHAVTDPSLLAGFTASYDSILYDGSLAGKLNRLKKALTPQTVRAA